MNRTQGTASPLDGTLIVLACALSHSTVAAAQAVVYNYSGPTATSSYGAAISGGGDLNQDGFADFVVTSPGALPSPHPNLIAYSGNTGTVLWTATYPSDGYYVSAVDLSPDLNGDGAADVIVGHYQISVPTGAAELRSGADGTVFRTHIIYQPDGNPEIDNGFGSRVTALDDLNNDGFVEYGVYAMHLTHSPPYKPAKFHVFDGNHGTPLHTQTFSPSGQSSSYEFAVAAGGDMDKNGIGDYLVARAFESTGGAFSSGVVRRFEGASGFQSGVVLNTQQFEYIGSSITPIEDRDNDGVDDFLCTFVSWFVTPTGLRTISMSSGSALNTTAAAPNRIIGRVLELTDDIDSDGLREILSTDWPLPSDTHVGKLTVLRSVDLAILYEREDIYSPLYLSPTSTKPFFPGSISNIGDTTGDGRSEWGVSSSNVNFDPTHRGIAEVLCYRPLYAHQTTIAPGKKQVSFSLSGGLANKGRPYFLLASMTGTAGIPLPNSVLPLTFDPLFEASLFLANSSVFQNTFGYLDSQDGTASAMFNGAFIPPAANGLTLHFAYAIYDDNGDWSSNAEAIKIDLF